MSQPFSLCEVEERGPQLRLKRADGGGVNHGIRYTARQPIGNCQQAGTLRNTNSRLRKRLVVARRLRFSSSDDSEDRIRLCRRDGDVPALSAKRPGPPTRAEG